MAESAKAYSDVLAATLTACDSDPVCAGRTRRARPPAAYDRLAAELAKRPARLRLPAARRDAASSGELTLDDLQDRRPTGRSARSYDRGRSSSGP